MTTIPFLCTQEANTREYDELQGAFVFKLRVYRDDQTSIPGLQIVSESVLLRSPSETIENDVVRFLMANAQPRTVSNVGELDSLMFIIGQQIKRGSANVLVLHEDDFDAFPYHSYYDTNGPVARYKVATPELKGKMLVLYRGTDSTTDGAPIVLLPNNDDGRYGISTNSEVAPYVKITNLLS